MVAHLEVQFDFIGKISRDIVGGGAGGEIDVTQLSGTNRSDISGGSRPVGPGLVERGSEMGGVRRKGVIGEKKR